MKLQTLDPVPVVFGRHHTDDKRKQGWCGETLVGWYFENVLGFEVQFNDDPYGWWDLAISRDGFTEECFTISVKTLSRFILSERFTIYDNKERVTISNTMRCDYLIIVARDPHNPRAWLDEKYAGIMMWVKEHFKLPVEHDELRIYSERENIAKLCRISQENLDQINSFNCR